MSLIPGGTDAFHEPQDLLLSAGKNDVVVKPISNDVVFEVTLKFLHRELKRHKAISRPRSES